MAQCPYPRCIQERRLIKNELKKSSKRILLIEGLERVAEELGSGKWKHYHEASTRTHLNADIDHLATDALVSNCSASDNTNNNNNKSSSSNNNKHNNNTDNYEAPARQQKQFVNEAHHNNNNNKKKAEGEDDEEKEETSSAAEAQQQRNHEENHRQPNETAAEEQPEPEPQSQLQLQNGDKASQQQYNNNNNSDSEQLEAHNHASDDKGDTKTAATNDVEVDGAQDENAAKVDGESTEASRNKTTSNNNNITNTTGSSAPATPRDQQQQHERERDRDSISPPAAVLPIDWQPNEKCHFCIGGRLLTVNANGDLEAETDIQSSSAAAECDDNVQRFEIDSDSNDDEPPVTSTSTPTAAPLATNALKALKTLSTQQPPPPALPLPLPPPSAAADNYKTPLDVALARLRHKHTHTPSHTHTHTHTHNRNRSRSRRTCNANKNNNNNNNSLNSFNSPFDILNNLLATQRNYNMTSMDSMAAQLAAIQSISGQLGSNIDWLQLAHQQQQQQQQHQQQQQQQQQQQVSSVTPTTSDSSTSAAAVSSPTSLKDSPSPSDATGEQPLDLSSKPSPNSSISGDLKRSKSLRTTPTPSARRPYRDEDLNSALQDVLSEKLDTRTAAARYGVPRSALRNKIFKLVLATRNANCKQPPSEVLQRILDDNEFSGDEGDDNSSMGSTPQLPDTPLDDHIPNHIVASATIHKLSRQQQHHHKNNIGGDSGVGRVGSGGGGGGGGGSDMDLSDSRLNTLLPDVVVGKRQSSRPTSSNNIAMQQLHLSPSPQTSQSVQSSMQQSTLTLAQALLNMDFNDLTMAANIMHNPLNNGNTPNGVEENLLLIQLMQLLQQLRQQQQQSQLPNYPHRLPQSDTPETSSSLDANEAGDDSSAILKIPSFKPVAGAPISSPSLAMQSACSPTLLCNSSYNNGDGSGSSSGVGSGSRVQLHTHRNGDSPHSVPSPGNANPLLAAAVAAANAAGSAATSRSGSSLPEMSPSLLHAGGALGVAERQSPPTFSMRDAMTNKIQRTMNEQSGKDVLLGDSGSDYKKPSISVVKNIGGTDTSRFGAAPNLLTSMSGGGVTGGASGSHNSHHHHLTHAHHTPHHRHLSQQEAAALAASKGTRPKRGKYRNYDRDSLVEAVKAVQRGEMSVHRAGSYYGVPHSTLEYKVKERHLMRPRKREPKPQPGLDGLSSSAKSNSSIEKKSSAAKNKNNNNNSSNNNAAAAAAAAAAAVSYSSSAPGNGINLPMFDTQLPYHTFWPHTPAAAATAFGQLQMDFSRNAATAHNAELFKRYQEEVAMRAASGSAGSAQNATTNHNSSDSPTATQNHHGAATSYGMYEDGGCANGESLLGGIIRKTLERKSDRDVVSASGGGALLDHLLVKKTALPFTNNRVNDYAHAQLSPSTSSVAAGSSPGTVKREGSPLMYDHIKRERHSPVHSSDEDTCPSGTDDMSEHNNNINNNISLGRTRNSKRNHTLLTGLRHRLLSHDDSETDASSVKSDQRTLNNGNNKTDDVNGSGCGMASALGAGAADIMPKTELGHTSILHEKLAQIKAEQQESEEHL